MTYLFDNNISFRFAHTLAALGVEVSAVRNGGDLGEHARDVDILEWLRGRECVLITADKHINTRPAEVAALKAASVTAVFFDRFWSKLDFWGQASWLVPRWPAIEQFVSTAPPGMCGLVQQRGCIRVL